MLSSFDWIVGAFMVVVTTASTVCSILTIYLIHAIGRWNGFLCIIYSMTVCQFIYDCSFYLVAEPYLNQPTIALIIQILTLFGGLSVTVWTNILSGLVFFIVMYRQPVDVWKYYPFFFFIAIVPSVCFTVFTLAYMGQDLRDTIYNSIRLASIVLNLVVYLIVKRQLDAISDKTSTGPLKELSSRLKYYPICQVITRIPATLYQFVYGFGPQDFEVQSSVAQTVAVLFYAMFIPSAGIAYFCVFLYMQPKALSRLKLLWQNIGKRSRKNLLCLYGIPCALLSQCCSCCCCMSCEPTDGDSEVKGLPVNTTFVVNELMSSEFEYDGAHTSTIPRLSASTGLGLSGSHAGLRDHRISDSSFTSGGIENQGSTLSCISSTGAVNDGRSLQSNSDLPSASEYGEMDEDELSRRLVTNSSNLMMNRIL